MRSPLKSGEEREDGSGKWDRRGMEGYEGVEKNDGKDVGGSEKEDREAEGGNESIKRSDGAVQEKAGREG